MDSKNESHKKSGRTKENSYTRKKSSAQKNEHLKALIKLKQEEFIIEKSLITHLENAKIDAKILQDIQRDHLNYTSKRQKICNPLQCSAKDIQDSWSIIKSEIEDNKNFGNLDVDVYKIKLQKLWEKIQEFHKNDYVESLREDESLLNQELLEFNQTLSRYENGDFSGSTLSKRRNRKNSVNLPDFEEVENFSDLIAKTGHTENWNNEDHLLFLNLRKKHKTIPALVNAIQIKCPDLSAKCIVNHEAWYKYYLELQDRQKAAIKDWRKQKEFERTILIEKSKSDVPDDTNENSGKITKNSIIENASESKKSSPENQALNIKKEEFKRRIGETEKITNITSKSKKSTVKNQTLDEKKEVIKRWKEEKENEKLMQEEQAKLREQSRQLLENRRKARAQRSKLAVAEYKRTKSLEAQVLKSPSNENKKEDILRSSELIKSFREQDNYYIERRKRMASTKSKNNCKVVEKSPTTEARVSTLLKYTEVWREKCKKRSENK